ncbi:hypothetical protein SGGMMB4_02641 [Sodalis glossinidius str. 'morsitans']|uniref:Hypothetical phage protein n=1 Tax=Sodalis glossinidius (strain morsitans) TaxID=343509 RepID=Q2NTT7_SODGM|nr:hypothetical protein [Sodalis glossinidius]BAE74438.1 hypothetical phage protein [Sodalis glossinidius str. 'morsitans']CRL45107.1 hypothetical protein SGGMMB4_02641 [Sodalis glossinidius str. 'morsitans']
MGQVAFDTQEFVETLEKSGLNKEQAKAISIAVRKSHEVADVATKRDLDDVRKDLSAEIADVRKDMAVGFDKINDKFEKLSMQMMIRLGLMVAAAVSIIAAILKI